MERGNIQRNKIRNENGDITTYTEEIQTNRSYFKNVYSTKLENFKEMGNSLEKYHISKLK